MTVYLELRYLNPQIYHQSVEKISSGSFGRWELLSLLYSLTLMQTLHLFFVFASSFSKKKKNSNNSYCSSKCDLLNLIAVFLVVLNPFPSTADLVIICNFNNSNFVTNWNGIIIMPESIKVKGYAIIT